MNEPPYPEICHSKGHDTAPKLRRHAAVSEGGAAYADRRRDLVEDAGHANPDNQFRFAGDGYAFNLQSTGFSTGTYALTFTATGDPNPHQVFFQIR